MPHEHMTDAQRQRLERFGVSASVDIHCHCLPGLDDGPKTMDDAVALCRALAADGVTTAVATPHQLGRYDLRNSASAVRAAAATLREKLAAEGVPLEVRVGADVRVDERIVGLVASGDVLTLGGGPYLLLELPHETYIEPEPLIRLLGSRGVRSIVTHPERHPAVRKRPEVIGPWLKAGAMLQLTAGSLLGKFGSAAEEAAWRWLGAGAAAFVATDAHDVARRPPCMTGALEEIGRRLGAAVAKRVCLENPARVLPRRRGSSAAGAAHSGGAPGAPAEVAREA